MCDSILKWLSVYIRLVEYSFNKLLNWTEIVWYILFSLIDIHKTHLRNFHFTTLNLLLKFYHLMKFYFCNITISILVKMGLCFFIAQFWLLIFQCSISLLNFFYLFNALKWCLMFHAAKIISLKFCPSI